MTNEATKQNKKALEEIAIRHDTNVIIHDIFGYVGVDRPKSLEEAKKLSDFWREALEKTKEGVERIQFVYQEKDKELPISPVKRLLKNLGCKVNPKTELGEIKYESAKPELIRYTKENILNLITQEQEWERLNKISHNSGTFSAPFVMLPKNLCYQVNIPLECITEIRFKLDYLKK